MAIGIGQLIIEQQDKIYGEFRGGYKYGPDYNRLRVILKHHQDNLPIERLVEELEDVTLRHKVRMWMAA